MTARDCEICGNTAHNSVFSAREMMFGLRERFEYLECSRCGCLQLIDVPHDLSRYYPRNYYSLDRDLAPVDGRFVSTLRRARATALLHAPARVVDTLARSNRIPAQFVWLAGLGLGTSSAVCDVGSGNGHSLVWMRRQGFSNLEGFDPYVSEDLQVDERVLIRKLAIDDMPGGWDLIMLNHSFEHMAEPARVLNRLGSYLNDGGSVLIRVPVADSWAWRTYRSDWVQLDAPRHLFLHTQRSITILAEGAGLKVSRLFFDSYALQFWGSEQYKRDIPLRDPRSYGEAAASGIFTDAEIDEFRRRSEDLNRRGDGDSAGFVLRAS